jgi:hypothetical protein
MLQESASTSWDPRALIVEPAASLKLYMSFLLVVCIITSVKLVKVWWKVPPFRTEGKKDNHPYSLLLQSTVASLKQWMSFNYLGWGIFASTSVYNLCNRLLDDKRVGSLVVVMIIREFSTTLTMALLVALFIFLTKWHISRRIEHLRKSC